MLRRQLERYGRWLIVIGFLMAVAIVSGGYILVNQRLQTPFDHRYPLNANFSTSSGFTPGLGQPVNVAGVRVGQIASDHVANGVAVLKMEIDPGKLKHVWENAHATLVENTPLKDMQVEIAPGGPPAHVAKKGFTIPLAQTAPPIDSDDFTNALDSDTRQYFSVLIGAFDRGVNGRAKDLRALIGSLAPTAKDVQAVGDALVQRRVELQSLVHELAIVARAAGSKDRQLAQVIDAGNATVTALASQEGPLQESIRKLPGTLSATRSTLGHVTQLANAITPALTELLPAVRRLPSTLKAVKPFLATATPVIKTKLRPLVKKLLPLSADLQPAVKNLSATTPSLSQAFKVLNYVVNELGYNPPGDDEGYQYWLAWFAHNSNSFLSTGDAQGTVWRTLSLFDCTALGPQLGPLIATVLGPICPTK